MIYPGQAGYKEARASALSGTSAGTYGESSGGGGGGGSGTSIAQQSYGIAPDPIWYQGRYVQPETFAKEVGLPSGATGIIQIGGKEGDIKYSYGGQETTLVSPEKYAIIQQQEQQNIFQKQLAEAKAGRQIRSELGLATQESIKTAKLTPEQYARVTALDNYRPESFMQLNKGITEVSGISTIPTKMTRTDLAPKFKYDIEKLAVGEPQGILKEFKSPSFLQRKEYEYITAISPIKKQTTGFILLGAGALIGLKETTYDFGKSVITKPFATTYETLKSFTTPLKTIKEIISPMTEGSPLGFGQVGGRLYGMKITGKVIGEGTELIAKPIIKNIPKKAIVTRATGIEYTYTTRQKGVKTILDITQKIDIETSLFKGKVLPKPQKIFNIKGVMQETKRISTELEPSGIKVYKSEFGAKIIGAELRKGIGKPKLTSFKLLGEEQRPYPFELENIELKGKPKTEFKELINVKGYSYSLTKTIPKFKLIKEIPETPFEYRLLQLGIGKKLIGLERRAKMIEVPSYIKTIKRTISSEIKSTKEIIGIKTATANFPKVKQVGYIKAEFVKRQYVKKYMEDIIKRRAEPLGGDISKIDILRRKLIESVKKTETFEWLKPISERGTKQFLEPLTEIPKLTKAKPIMGVEPIVESKALLRIRERGIEMPIASTPDFSKTRYSATGLSEYQKYPDMSRRTKQYQLIESDYEFYRGMKPITGQELFPKQKTEFKLMMNQKKDISSASMTSLIIVPKSIQKPIVDVKQIVGQEQIVIPKLITKQITEGKFEFPKPPELKLKVPKTIYPPNDFYKREPKKKKKRTYLFEPYSFIPKYKPSVRAVAMGIWGKKPKGYRTGISLRPMLK